MYEITRELSGRFQNACKPVRNEAGMLLKSAEEEMHWWREHFQTVLKRGGHYIRKSFLGRFSLVDY